MHIFYKIFYVLVLLLNKIIFMHTVIEKVHKIIFMYKSKTRCKLNFHVIGQTTLPWSTFLARSGHPVSYSPAGHPDV